MTARVPATGDQAGSDRGTARGVSTGRAARARVARGVATVPGEVKASAASSHARAVGAWPMPLGDVPPPAAARPPSAGTRMPDTRPRPADPGRQAGSSPPPRTGADRPVGPPIMNVWRRNAIDQLRLARARLNRGRFSRAR
ncbi:hypothetical protein ACFQX7_12815 [Luedemannella flava]